MRRRGATALASLIVLLALAGTAAGGLPCDPQTVRERGARAPAIVQGRIVAARRGDGLLYHGIAEVEVQRVFRGAVTNPLLVAGLGPQPADISQGTQTLVQGLYASVGEVVTLYLYGGGTTFGFGDRFAVDACTPSHPGALTAAERELLGAGVEPPRGISALAILGITLPLALAVGWLPMAQRRGRMRDAGP